MRAKLLNLGDNQLVRLPSEFRFPEGVTEVEIRREGRHVILEIDRTWPKGMLDLVGDLGGAHIERPHHVAPPRQVKETKDA